MKQEQIHIYKAIDEILWFDWDPIGVNDTEEARDEYQGYIPQIFNLKVNGDDEETIAQKLNEIITKRMGLVSNLHHCKLVAKKIIEIK